MVLLQATALILRALRCTSADAAALTVFKASTEDIEDASRSTRPAGVSYAVEYNGDWGELWQWPAGDNDTLLYNSTFDCDEYSGRMEEVVSCLLLSFLCKNINLTKTVGAQNDAIACRKLRGVVTNELLIYLML